MGHVASDDAKVRVGSAVYLSKEIQAGQVISLVALEMCLKGREVGSLGVMNVDK